MRSLRELSIEANSPPQANFFDDVIQCLALCEGPLILELDLPQVTDSLPQAITGVRASAGAARNLLSGKLPLVTGLRIGFVSMNDMIPVNRQHLYVCRNY